MGNFTTYSTPDFSASVNLNPTQQAVKGNASSEALSAMGSTFSKKPGILGAATALGVGIWKYMKAGSLLYKRQQEETTRYRNARYNAVDGGNTMLNQQAAFQNPGYFSNLYAKDGAKLPEYVREFFRDVASEKQNKIRQFRDGGVVNVIAKGVLHSKDNELGDKGIPVVVEQEGGKLEKVAEIEKNELVCTLEVTEKIEEHSTKYKENPEDTNNLLELGKLMQHELLYNTKDNQGELTQQ